MQRHALVVAVIAILPLGCGSGERQRFDGQVRRFITSARVAVATMGAPGKEGAFAKESKAASAAFSEIQPPPHSDAESSAIYHQAKEMVEALDMHRASVSMIENISKESLAQGKQVQGLEAFTAVSAGAKTAMDVALDKMERDLVELLR